MRIRFLGTSVLAIAATTASPALAQDKVSPPVDTEARETGSEDVVPLDDNVIIVTAEKLGRTLDETNSSVVVYTGQQLEERSIDDLYDVALRTPNVVQSFGEKGFAIRGIDQRLGAGAGLLVTTVVDGAAMPNNQSTFFGPYSTWDVAQVEILRGPQGTTQGRNAVGGAIIGCRVAEPARAAGGGARPRRARGSFG